ncbi:MAG: hypothetical protein ACAH95_17580 [Fimbriimonas sp.]
MTHRDRAWRRRTERILTHREEEAKHRTAEGPAQPLKDFKQHQPGKLTPAQSLRQDWQLRSDAEEGFSTDNIV